MPSLEAVLDRDYTVHRIDGRADVDALPVAARGRIRAITSPVAVPALQPSWSRHCRRSRSSPSASALDAVDLEHAKARGVRVTNTPGVLTDDVADMALALILATLRRICVGDRLVRAGRWGKEAIPLATKFTGKRLGILGLGRIGQAVAKRASGFDVTIAYTDQRAFDDVLYRFEPSLVALARDSDILVVAAAGGPARSWSIADSHGGSQRHSHQRIARGSVVDEAAGQPRGASRRCGSRRVRAEPRCPKLCIVWRVVLQPQAVPRTRRADMGRIVLDLAAQFAESRCRRRSSRISAEEVRCRAV